MVSGSAHYDVSLLVPDHTICSRNPWQVTAFQSGIIFLMLTGDFLENAQLRSLKKAPDQHCSADQELVGLDALYQTRANGAAAFANRKAHTAFNSDRPGEADGDCGMCPWL